MKNRGGETPSGNSRLSRRKIPINAISTRRQREDSIALVPHCLGGVITMNRRFLGVT